MFAARHKCDSNLSNCKTEASRSKNDVLVSSRRHCEDDYLCGRYHFPLPSKFSRHCRYYKMPQNIHTRLGPGCHLFVYSWAIGNMLFD